MVQHNWNDVCLALRCPFSRFDCKLHCANPHDLQVLQELALIGDEALDNPFRNVHFRLRPSFFLPAGTRLTYLLTLGQAYDDQMASGQYGSSHMGYPIDRFHSHLAFGELQG